ncbi:TVP38/TMEM64 family protein [Lactococcus hodotermopsidis]|uniref:TVP38/TMEM64 family membrane protein n=1 Tax=Pseudolactococcus hodotermopsidis TaxID=2709157 RepID=A0A6A0BCT5_9LACT|nr:TVP38/TMEM64 family protein [Lactococcus hodotermopsidis]GFH43239.1 TVP38/TMEM64 family protein [Lactococcus hodotermopsidis]
MNEKVLKIVHRLFNVVSILGIIGCLIGGYYLYRIGALHDQKALSELILAHYFLGPFIFIGVQIVQVVIPIIPGGLSTAAGVMIFGPYKGFLYNYIGIVIGSIILFHLGRVYGVALAKTFIKEKHYNKYMTWVNKGQGKYNLIFFIAILLPVAPDDALVLISSQTKMSFRFFLFTIFIGKPLPIYLYSYLLIHGGGFLADLLT